VGDFCLQLERQTSQPALFTKAKTVIGKVADFIIEAGLFNTIEFNANCFLFTTRISLPLQLARYRSTLRTTRNLAVSHEQRWQSDPGGEPFMNNAG